MNGQRGAESSLPQVGKATLPDGRTLVVGQEVRIAGVRGVFRFQYEWTVDGSLTFFGPLDTQHASWRSFRPERVRTVFRSPKSHSARRAAS